MVPRKTVFLARLDLRQLQIYGRVFADSTLPLLEPGRLVVYDCFETGS